MNAVAIKTAGRYLGAWGTIVLCVILLSLLFTFLGTITCAVLAGMMMGAFKGAKWFSVSVSLVFPTVIFGMARGAKVELTPQQITLLAALCFGTYWVTYLVSAFVFFCEQKDRKSVKPPASAPPGETLAPGAPAAPAGFNRAATLSELAGPGTESCLEHLQGDWVCEASRAGHSLCRKVIQIKASKLELRTVDANGRSTLLARGDLTLQSVRACQAPVVAQGATEPVDSIVGL
jgi:hypothetical protein